MRRADEVSPEKLRGGFYTPAPLVMFTLERLREARGASLTGATVLEPSAGDGAFVRALAAAADAPRRLVAVEREPSEAAKLPFAAAAAPAEVHNESFFAWAARAPAPVDAVVGNPPFVRYQFVPAEDRAQADALLHAQGRAVGGVANLWVPFVLVALHQLRPGGAFALVLPAELLSTASTGPLRAALSAQSEALRLDLFPRGSFPKVLQEVVVLSGRWVAAGEGRARVGLSGALGPEEPLPPGEGPWTGLVLDAESRAALAEARLLPEARPFGALARLSVSTVTGANAFFTVTDTTLAAFDLTPWARPLLARAGHTGGLIVTEADHAAARAEGERAWLLDLSADRPPPHARALAYLQTAEAEGIPERYKCRVRRPWYRVPVVAPGALLLAKRAHLHHRLQHNAAGLLTTDTIYQGAPLPSAGLSAADLVVSFHTSLTLLSVELEGRSYGGGVSELVPSEIARLSLLSLPLGEHLPQLDALSRAHGGQADAAEVLIEATDALFAARCPAYAALLPGLRRALGVLRGRRLGR